MVRHVILWKFREQYYAAQIEEMKKEIKQGLEGLKGKVPGLLEIRVITDPLPSSNCDLMLDSSFESEEALKGYSVHPAHVAVANEKVRPFMASRICMDYEDA